MADLRPSHLTAEMRANFRRLYADLAGFGVLTGSTMAFLAIYAARLGGVELSDRSIIGRSGDH
ncbi:MAG: hypothetical protein ACM3PY_06525 [Omnitrophica WOR_2 bacterium]